MKRTIAALARDAKEQEQDKLLRAQIAREQENEDARKRQKARDTAYSTKWKAILGKWRADGLQIGSRLPLSLPIVQQQGPSVCPSPFFHSFFFHSLFSCDMSFLYFNRFMLGASLDLGKLGREPSARGPPPPGCLEQVAVFDQLAYKAAN